MRDIWQRQRIRDELRRGAEIAALTGFAIVQPVLDVMGRAPDFFLFRGADARDVIALTVLLVVVPTSALWGLGITSSILGDRVRHGVHVVTLAVLATLVALHALKTLTGLAGLVLVAAAMAIGVGLVYLHQRRASVARWLRYAAPAPLVFALLFLFASSTSVVVTGDETANVFDVAGSDTSVVLIVMDEFPLLTLLNDDGEVDERFYPSFARLASTSTWFRNATTQAGDTTLAMPSLLTGRFPNGKAPHVEYHPENVFTLLGGSHHMRVFEPYTRLCPANVCEDTLSTIRKGGGGGLRSLLRDALDTWQRVMSPNLGGEDPANAVGVDTEVDDFATPDEGDLDFALEFPKAPQAPSLFSSFLASIDGRDRTFSFLHLLLPHVPWRFLPDGRMYVDQPVSRLNAPKPEEPWASTVDRHRHILQTMYTDALLGRILDRLEAQGGLDDALLVVTADHGINFRPGSKQGFKDVGVDNAHEVAWVPLFVKRPGQTVSEIVDDNVLLVDVVPTIADVLGIELPWEVDGRSLFGPARTNQTKPFWNAPGDSVEIEGSQWLPRLRQGVTDDMFPDFDVGDPFALYRVHRLGALIGTRPDEHPSFAAEGVAAGLDRPGDYEQVSLSAQVPALMRGSVEGSVGEEEAVVVSLNGVIGGVADLFEHPGREQVFATMAPPELFRDGANDVRLYLAREVSGGVELAELGSDSS